MSSKDEVLLVYVVTIFRSLQDCLMEVVGDE
jgi:hypothetical protein